MVKGIRTMAITTSKLMELKKRASEIRDKTIQAKATMAEVDNNITATKKELAALGIDDVENVEQEIEKLEAQMEDLYNKVCEKLQKWV